MIQLDTRSYPPVDRLFDSYDFHEAHFGSVLAGFIPGRVFADAADHPTCAAILPDEGFLYLGGNPSAVFLQDQADRLHRVDASECVEAFYADPGWKDLVPLLSPDGKSAVLKRNLYRLPVGWQARMVPEPIRPTPDGVELRVGEAPGRLSVTVTVDGVEASFCSALVRKGRAEIDVGTAEPFRRRGYGRAAASRFLSECAARGIEPEWNCWDFREESNAMAAGLGFLLMRVHEAFLWDKYL